MKKAKVFNLKDLSRTVVMWSLIHMVAVKSEASFFEVTNSYDCKSLKQGDSTKQEWLWWMRLGMCQMENISLLVICRWLLPCYLFPFCVHKQVLIYIVMESEKHSCMSVDGKCCNIHMHAHYLIMRNHRIYLSTCRVNETGRLRRRRDCLGREM